MHCSIRRKIVGGYLSAIVLMGAVAIYGLSIGGQSIKVSVARDSMVLADALLRSIHDKVDHWGDILLVYSRGGYLQEALTQSNRSAEAGGWASDPPPPMVGSLTADTNTGAPAGRSASGRQPLRRKLENDLVNLWEDRMGYPVYADILVTDKYGRDLTRAGEPTGRHPADQEWWLAARQIGRYTGHAVVDGRSGTLVLPLALSVVDEQDAFMGVIKADIYLSAAVRDAELQIKSLATTEVKLICGVTGKLVYATGLYRHLEDLSTSALMGRLQGDRGNFIDREGGIEKLFSYVNMKTSGMQSAWKPNWRLVLAHDSAEILKPHHDLRKRMITGSMLLIGFGLVLAFFTARSITTPLDVLTRGVRVIASGDLAHRVPVTSRDEMAILSAAFNQMSTSLQQAMQALKQSNEELERRVAERTAKLTLANQQLSKEMAEREKMAVALRQRQKLAAIGTLAGGIAHDFNNLLTSIIGFSELVLDEAAGGSLLEENIQEVLGAANRARDLVRQILTFARHTDGDFKPVRVRRVVEDVLRLLKATLPKTVTIDAFLDSDARVMGDASQFHQVFMNLCVNAAQAMDASGGRIDVRLANETLNRPQIPAGSRLTPGDYLKATITDDGPGIGPEALESIFEPYYTTKAPGDGTGLGLAVVHGAVKSCKGEIVVDSALEQGTTFTIYFPLATDESGDPDDDHRTGETRGRERILIVDDETPIIKMTTRALERLGYRVTAFTDSREALDHFKSAPHAVDLVVSDLTMPGLCGDRMAQAMHAVRNDLPIILCTGYCSRISEAEARKAGVRALLFKPLDKDELAGAIRRLLDHVQAPGDHEISKRDRDQQTLQ